MTGSLDGTLKIWDATDTGATDVFDTSHREHGTVGFSEDGRLLARSDFYGHQTTLWTAPGWKKLAAIPQDTFELLDHGSAGDDRGELRPC